MSRQTLGLKSNGHYKKLVISGASWTYLNLSVFPKKITQVIGAKIKDKEKP